MKKTALSLGGFSGSLKKSHFDRFHYLVSCDFFGTTPKIHSRYNALSNVVQKIHKSQNTKQFKHLKKANSQ